MEKLLGGITIGTIVIFFITVVGYSVVNRSSTVYMILPRIEKLKIILSRVLLINTVLMTIVTIINFDKTVGRLEGNFNLQIIALASVFFIFFILILFIILLTDFFKNKMLTQQRYYLLLEEEKWQITGNNTKDIIEVMNEDGTLVKHLEQGTPKNLVICEEEGAVAKYILNNKLWKPMYISSAVILIISAIYLFYTNQGSDSTSGIIYVYLAFLFMYIAELLLLAYFLEKEKYKNIDGKLKKESE